MPEMAIDALPIFLLDLLKRSGMRCIVLDGYTGSGKSTVVSEVTTLLSTSSIPHKEFHIDWYIVDRDKRNYREDARLMDLTGWFDLDRAAADLTKLQRETVSFVAYDRETGKRSKSLTLDALGDKDILIVEGLYGFLTAEHLKLPCLRVFFSMTDDTLRERLYKRNTYIPRERLEYEIETIYIPSMTNYMERLKEKNIDYVKIDVNDFTRIKIL